MAAAAAPTIPTAAAAMASLDDLLTTAGAAAPIKEYITARGISATPTLALIAEDAAAFTDKVVRPFLSGFTRQGAMHKAAKGDEDVSKAILVHLFTEARRQWQAATATPPAPPPRTMPAAAPPAATSQTTAAAPEEKPPKTFSQRAAQVRAYEEKTIDGVKRTFPAEKLLGAEEVLARLWHEHTRSKDYKPLGIGEIVSRRTWTSGGDLNTMASSRSSSSAGAKILKLIDDKLVAEDSDEWAPKGIMLTLDGIEAAKWAWILCGYDEERRVERFTDWFGEKARSKQASIPAVHSFWADAMCRHAATRNIMADTATWNEFIFENVEMSTADAKQISSALGAQPILVTPSMQWSRKGHWDRLRVEEARRAADTSLDMDGLTFDDSVLSGRRRLPCATTPAADENGRAAPRGCRGKIQPKLSIPAPKLHHIPTRFTKWAGAAELDDRTRHRLIGNGWHWGVARHLLLILVVATSWTQSQAAPAGPPRTSTIDWVASLWRHGGPIMGPAPAQQDGPDAMEHLDEDQHWHRSATIPHPMQVVQKVKLLIEDKAEETAAWMAARTHAVRSTYSTPDKPAVTQIPVLLELLRRLNLTADLTDGFDMIGALRPGPAWRKRQVNADYVRRKVATASTGEHTETLLQELVDEVKLGRVIGPTRPPAWLKAKATALPWALGATELVEPPPGEAFLAASFAIIQFDENGEPKIRRGEDWPLRPQHHHRGGRCADPSLHRSLRRPGAAHGRRRRHPGVWARSPERLPPMAGQAPGACGTFVATPAGMTFWFHLAMNFGATASVWNFNRGGDALQQLLRGLLLLTAGHYVDDFNGLEFEELGESAGRSFEELFAALGFRIKASKFQPAAPKHVVQGVAFELSRRGVTVSPTPQRVRRILEQIRRALDQDAMKPDEAQKLAWRLSFLTQAVFGGVGKAPTKAVYARPADTSAHSDDKLSLGLRSALVALEHILPTVSANISDCVTRCDDMDTAVLYADAFFLDGERRHKAGHVPTSADTGGANRAKKGWGFVLRLGGSVFYDHGVVPTWFLQKFAARRAFIYMLEVFTQMVALAAFSAYLPGAVTAFIDNTAGQAALSKGYGKDPAMNAMLATFWAMSAKKDILVDFRRVPSKANVADAVSQASGSNLFLL
ncbi:unnamed protein product [Symbiodinium sp. CCMP2456]|nr:unnamed protein product [Symbiodinium sp. CCMP2456]